MKIAPILCLGGNGDRPTRGWRLSRASPLRAFREPRVEREMGCGWAVVRIQGRHGCEFIMSAPFVWAPYPTYYRRGNINPIMEEKGVSLTFDRLYFFLRNPQVL